MGSGMAGCAAPPLPPRPAEAPPPPPPSGGACAAWPLTQPKESSPSKAASDVQRGWILIGDDMAVGPPSIGRASASVVLRGRGGRESSLKEKRRCAPPSSREPHQMARRRGAARGRPARACPREPGGRQLLAVAPARPGPHDRAGGAGGGADRCRPAA